MKFRWVVRLSNIEGQFFEERGKSCNYGLRERVWQILRSRDTIPSFVICKLNLEDEQAPVQQKSSSASNDIWASICSSFVRWPGFKDGEFLEGDFYLF